MKRARSKHAGFTLLELMTAIAVLAVLLSIGVPAFTSMITNNKLAAQSNELVAALTLARSESVKRAVPVSVCAGTGSTCSKSTDWSTGWIVFQDDTGTTGELDGTDQTLQVFEIPDKTTITGDAAFVGYLPTGARAKRVITVEKSGCTGNNKREITVELTGRISLKRKACS